MKRIFLLLFLLFSSPVASEPLALMERLRESIVIVGRAGCEALVPGVVLGDGTIVLAPVIPPIDSQAAPYLLRLHDGEILTAEIINADEERGIVLLQLPRTVATPVVAEKQLSGDRATPPFFSASIPLGLLEGEPVQLHLARKATRDQSATDDGNPAPLDLAIARSGYPLFDLSGRLVGVTGRFDSETQVNSWMPLELAFDRLEEASELLVDRDSKDRENQSALLETKKDGETEVPSWLVVVENAEGTTYQSCHGIVVDSGGLIVTKASMLGPKPICRIGAEAWPAVLLAEDSETDLALLAISEKNLTPISWSDSVIRVGSEVSVPVINPCPPLNRSISYGFVSHMSGSHPMNPSGIWSSEEVTSLNILIDQAKTQPTVVFVIPGGAGKKAGILPGDRLTMLNEKPLENRKVLRETLASRRVGELVTLKVMRKGEEADLNVSLRAARLAPPPLMNGRLDLLPALEALPSVRRSGFPETWVHDARLAPWQMLTPLLDSSGSALGINIASVGYGRCLALPAETVQSALARMLKQPLNL